MVLNEEGEVVTWQFTNSNSIDEVQPLLCSLKERIKVFEGTHFTIYVDNCCHVQSKLSQHWKQHNCEVRHISCNTTYNASYVKKAFVVFHLYE